MPERFSPKEETTGTITIMIFFFNDTATTEIYTLSLHDALPISSRSASRAPRPWKSSRTSSTEPLASKIGVDRKSTRLNSSHGYISYAVFCLKKKICFRIKRELVLDIAGAFVAARVYFSAAGRTV